MRLTLLATLGLLLSVQPTVAMAKKPASNDSSTAESSMDSTAQNPLLAPWTGPFGGVPLFDQARVQHFEPAIDAAIAEELAEIDRIASNPKKPTFDNTIAALEDAGRTFNRVMTVYGVFRSTMSDDQVREVSRNVAPKLAAIGDQITQNEALFARIEAVYKGKKYKKLTAEQQRLTWHVYNNFARRGAQLDAAK